MCSLSKSIESFGPSPSSKRKFWSLKITVRILVTILVII